MSHGPISRSPDLKRLRDEGFDLEVRSGYLLVQQVPYLTSGRTVQRGVLVCELNLAGNIAAKPKTHVMFFAGEIPCEPDGSPLSKIINSSDRKSLAPGIDIDHTFSSKPGPQGYADYYEKVRTYVAILSSAAQKVDPHASARTFPVIAVQGEDESSPFRYLDSASSRAEIVSESQKLKLDRVAIVGLGGTGSYVLDLVAKTPVDKILLFDGDYFFQHNAFRSPGAPSMEDLQARPNKAVYFAEIYGKIHKGIVAHPCYLTQHNLDLLDQVDFVFLSMDSGPDKKAIIEHLFAIGAAFVDVGMGVEKTDDGSLMGIVRVTTSTPEKQAHVPKRVSFAQAGDNEYDANTQIADLNCLNATLAVIRWKKLFGFYLDLEHEYHSSYATSGNTITNEDQREPS